MYKPVATVIVSLCLIFSFRRAVEGRQRQLLTAVMSYRRVVLLCDEHVPARPIDQLRPSSGSSCLSRAGRTDDY